MTALRHAALLVALSVAPGACAQSQTAPQSAAPGPGKVPQPRQEKIFPVGSSWTAVSLNGKPFSGDRPSFTLDQQFRAKGFAGCNTYAATAYPLREQGLAVGGLAPLVDPTTDQQTTQVPQQETPAPATQSPSTGA